MKTAVILLLSVIFLLGCGGCGGTKSTKKLIRKPKIKMGSPSRKPPPKRSSEPVVESGQPEDGMIALDTVALDEIEMPEMISGDRRIAGGGVGSMTIDRGSVRARVLVPMAGEETTEVLEEAVAEDFRGQLTPGNLAYDIPPQMKLGNKYRVTLRVDDTLTEKLTEGLSEHVSVESGIEVSMTMRAVLTGKNFIIDTTLSSATQLRKFNKPTIWEWDVTPKRSGKQSLRLKVICVLKRQGFSDDNFDLPVFEVERDIKVNLGYIIKSLIVNNWKGILGAIGGSGVVGWIISLFRKRKEEDESDNVD